MPLIVFVACLAVYVATLHPSVAGGDSGELVFVARELGVAHAPGYPLYTLIAHAFTWLPSGSVAWRVNLLSAVCDAAAASILFAVVRRASGDAVAAAVAALLFAFSPLVWTYATHAEVFALNNLFVALLLWLALRWNDARDGSGVSRVTHGSRSDSRVSGNRTARAHATKANAAPQRTSEHDDRTACVIAVTVGLGLTNHHTLLLVALPLAVWMAVVSRGALLRPRTLAKVTLCAAAGLLPYVHLPLAARHATTLSWGDPSSVAGFVDVLLRRDYGTFGLSGGASVGLSGFAKHIGALAYSFGTGSLWLGPIFAVIAVTFLWRRSDDAAGRTYVALLVFALVFSIVAFAALANLPLEDPFYRAVTSRFWQQPMLIAFVLAGIGLAHTTRHLPWRTVALVVVPLQIGLGFRAHDESANRHVESYGRAILEDLPADSLLLVYGDLISNAVRYEQSCEGVRPDVVVLDQEMMTKPWYIRRAKAEHPALTLPGTIYHPRAPSSFDMRTFVAANIDERPIHVYPGVKHGDTSWADAYLLVPDGVSLEVLPKGRFDDGMIDAVASDATLASVRKLERPDETRYPPGTWEHVVRTDYRELFHRRGVWLLDRALARKDSRETYVQARDALAEAAAEWPWPPPWYVTKNLGLAASKLARWDPDARADAVRAWQSYLELAPPGEKDRDAIRETLADLAR